MDQIAQKKRNGSTQLIPSQDSAGGSVSRANNTMSLLQGGNKNTMGLTGGILAAGGALNISNDLTIQE